METMDDGNVLAGLEHILGPKEFNRMRELVIDAAYATFRVALATGRVKWTRQGEEPHTFSYHTNVPLLNARGQCVEAAVTFSRSFSEDGGWCGYLRFGDIIARSTYDVEIRELWREVTGEPWLTGFEKPIAA